VASDGVAVLGVNPKVGGTGIGDNGELLLIGTELDIDEVLGVHVILHADVLTGLGVLGSASHERLLLVKVVSDGEGVVLKRDSISRDEADDGGDESEGVHYQVLVFITIKFFRPNSLFK